HYSPGGSERMTSTGLSSSRARTPQLDNEKPGAVSRKRKLPLTTSVGVGSIFVVLAVWSLLSAFVFSEKFLPSLLAVPGAAHPLLFWRQLSPWRVMARSPAMSAPA